MTRIILFLVLTVSVQTYLFAQEHEPLNLTNVSQIEAIYVLEGHTSTINSIDFSPDGKYIASGSDDKTVIVWTLETGKQLLMGDKHTEQVERVAFTPDGKYLLSGGKDESIFVWSLETGKVERELTAHEAQVRSFAFSNSGHIFASGDFNGQVIFWDTNTWEPIYTVELALRIVWSIAFSPDDNLVAFGMDGSISLLNIEEQSVVEFRELDNFSQRVNDLSFSSDGGSLIATIENDGGIYIWNVETQKSIFTYPEALGIGLTSSLLISDETLLIMGDALQLRFVDSTIKGGREIVTQRASSNSIRDIDSNSDESLIAVASGKEISVYGLP